jgi:hypothetical protein
MSHATGSLFPRIDEALPNEPDWLEALRRRQETLWVSVRNLGTQQRCHLSDQATYVQSDALQWLSGLPANSIHAVVTDPPYGMVEYDEKNHSKLRRGKGGVWRIPPSFDGATRKPVPRFTVLSKEEILNLYGFFSAVAYGLLKALVPGGHVFVASNPLISTTTFHAFLESGFEKRGEVIRLVQTLRGGDRPKGAEDEFSGVTAMPRSCWEPWGVFRKPIEGTLAENLRTWGTGGLRRISDEEPFKDVIHCSPTQGLRRKLRRTHRSSLSASCENSFVPPFRWESESSTIPLQDRVRLWRQLMPSNIAQSAPTLIGSTLQWRSRRFDPCRP